MTTHQVKHLLAKVKRAWIDRTLWRKAKQFLAASARIPCETVLAQLKLPRTDRRLDVRRGFADHRGRTDHRRSNREHVRRIIAAYKAAKQVQDQAPQAFTIRGLWAEWIDVNFKELITALNNADETRLATLFENLHRESFTRGAGGYYEYARYRTSLTGRFYLRTVWCRFRDIFLNLGGHIDDVQTPLVGNPTGIFINNRLIHSHTFRYAYHALEMRQWLRDIHKAVVVEIGGGFGGQAYQFTRLAETTLGKYLIFDIPEVASICSYFLLTALPEKRIRLFGEGPVSVGPEDSFDLAVFPHFEIVQLPERSIDLFHNACSFSEMDAISSTEYLRIIERCCRRFFSHINHDVRFTYHNPDGTTSTSLLGSELVPNPAIFRQIFKKPRVFCLPEGRSFLNNEYLYERLPGV